MPTKEQLNVACSSIAILYSNENKSTMATHGNDDMGDNYKGHILITKVKT